MARQGGNARVSLPKAALAALLLFATGALVGESGSPLQEGRLEKPVLMLAEDGHAYAVKPEETLGQAVLRAKASDHSHAHSAKVLTQETTPPPEETGNCVPETLEKKPEGSVACKCYEATECKGGESLSCKRHCKKHLCQCCSI